MGTKTPISARVVRQVARVISRTDQHKAPRQVFGRTMPYKANVSIVLAGDKGFDVLDLGLVTPGHFGNLADHAAQGRLDLLLLEHVPSEPVAE